MPPLPVVGKGLPTYFAAGATPEKTNKSIRTGQSSSFTGGGGSAIWSNRTFSMG